jgi:hypothetical protein
VINDNVDLTYHHCDCAQELVWCVEDLVREFLGGKQPGCETSLPTPRGDFRFIETPITGFNADLYDGVTNRLLEAHINQVWGTRYTGNLGDGMVEFDFIVLETSRGQIEIYAVSRFIKLIVTPAEREEWTGSTRIALQPRITHAA